MLTNMVQIDMNEHVHSLMTQAAYSISLGDEVKET